MFLWVQLHHISIGLDKALTPNMNKHYGLFTYTDASALYIKV